MTQTPTKIVYTASATTSGGRQGHAVSSDGILDLDLTAPKETGGPGTGTNPEQLFAAGYAACFHSALKLVAGSRKVDVSGSGITASVGIGKDGEAFGLTVSLTGTFPGLSREDGQELMEAAHQVCPYSRATRGNIDVTLDVLDAAAA